MTHANPEGRSIAYIVVASLYALMMLFSGVTKVIQHPEVVKGLSGQLGVPQGLLPVLGALLIAGALGLLAGIVRPQLGVAAAVGLMLYFVGAILTHVVAGDFAGITSPLVPLLLAVASFVLAKKHQALKGRV